MKCRIANQNDLVVLKELWYECFLEHDSKESIDFYFENSFDLEHTFILEVENEIVTSLQLNQHQIMYKGNIEKVSFVVGVATFNKHRKKGYMRVLLEYAIKYAKEIYNQNYMILQAYNWDIYRPFGFDEKYYKSKTTYKIDELNNNSAVDISKFNEKQMLDIYNEYVSSFDGYKIRDEAYFNLNKKTNAIDNIKVTLSENAYMMYAVDNNKVIANEVAFKTKEDLLNLIKTIMLEENVLEAEISSDLLNFDTDNKEIFMMVKELKNNKFDEKENLYISEWT